MLQISFYTLVASLQRFVVGTDETRYDDLLVVKAFKVRDLASHYLKWWKTRSQRDYYGIEAIMQLEQVE